MKSKIIILLALVPLFLISCDDTRTIEAPSFTITADSTQYLLGSPTTFLIAGQPNVMTFYSGEPGHEYQYKDRTQAEGGRALFTFNSSVTGNALANLSLVSSANLSFEGDTCHADSLLSINSAYWTVLKPKYSTVKSSGNMFSDTVVINNDSTKYIAFKYVGTSATQPTWTIKNMYFQNRLNSATSFAIADSTFATYNRAVFTTNLTVATVTTNTPSNQVIITGKPIAGISSTDAVYVFIKNLDFKRAQPDVGINMGEKSYTNSVFSFPYTYIKAGAYKATFVGKNVTYVGNKSNVVQLDVLVK